MDHFRYLSKVDFAFYIFFFNWFAIWGDYDGRTFFSFHGCTELNRDTADFYASSRLQHYPYISLWIKTKISQNCTKPISHSRLINFFGILWTLKEKNRMIYNSNSKKTCVTERNGKNAWIIADRIYSLFVHLSFFSLLTQISVSGRFSTGQLTVISTLTTISTAHSVKRKCIARRIANGNTQGMGSSTPT